MSDMQLKNIMRLGSCVKQNVMYLTVMIMVLNVLIMCWKVNVDQNKKSEESFIELSYALSEGLLNCPNMYKEVLMIFSAMKTYLLE